MDEITKKVIDMYSLYPYPFPTSSRKKTNELLNLLRIFSIENRYEFDGKSVLDAGTGTGHRLMQAASFYKNSNFIAIDYSQHSVNIAKELALKQNVSNVNFKIKNLMNDLSDLGRFEVILCMGVLHHLSDPKVGLQNLCSILHDNGLLFLYVYGKLGGHQRMIQKKIVSLLIGNSKKKYEKGVKLVKELKFDNLEYGWNLDIENENEKNALIVDAFLHANENLYDFDDLDRLMKCSGLYGYCIFGITTKKIGLLFDTQIDPKIRIPASLANINNITKSTYILEAYQKLDLKDRCRILELFYEPNGYTIVGLTKQMYESLDVESRIKNNLILC